MTITTNTIRVYADRLQRLANTLDGLQQEVNALPGGSDKQEAGWAYDRAPDALGKVQTALDMAEAFADDVTSLLAHFKTRPASEVTVHTVTHRAGQSVVVCTGIDGAGVEKSFGVDYRIGVALAEAVSGGEEPVCAVEQWQFL